MTVKNVQSEQRRILCSATEMNWLATCVVLVCLGLTATVGQAAPRNVVLIISDDHGRELGAYGSKDVRTPSLDALAADGTLFTSSLRLGSARAQPVQLLR